jgi:hypothetical protein
MSMCFIINCIQILPGGGRLPSLSTFPICSIRSFE